MPMLLLSCALLLMPSVALASGPAAFGKAFNRVEKSVVLVEASQGRTVRRGGGFIASTDGLIVCASYTLERAKTVRVKIDGAWHGARVVATEPRLRVALLKVEPPDRLSAVAVASAPDLKEGNWVVAVERGLDGKARGMAGTVSHSPRALGKSPPVVLVDTASMAGSPLVNLRGEVVGMSLGRISKRRGRATALAPLRAFLLEAAQRANDPGPSSSVVTGPGQPPHPPR